MAGATTAGGAGYAAEKSPLYPSLHRLRRATRRSRHFTPNRRWLRPRHLSIVATVSPDAEVPTASERIERKLATIVAVDRRPPSLAWLSTRLGVARPHIAQIGAAGLLLIVVASGGAWYASEAA